MIRPLALALQLLTRLPIPSSATAPRPEQLGQSVLFFPAVGLVIGALLAGVHFALEPIDAGIRAGLLLTVWVLITGGLHLDGLADSADAWIGGQGNRERTLAIMKDPRSGPIAIVAIGLVLLNKFAALQLLLANDAVMALLLAPVLGRTVIVLLLLTTPYVRTEGLGSPYAHYLPRLHSSLLVVLIALSTIALLQWQGGIALIMLSVVYFGLRHWLIARLGGITGDGLGAACELAETVVLIGLAA